MNIQQAVIVLLILHFYFGSFESRNRGIFLRSKLLGYSSSQQYFDKNLSIILLSRFLLTFALFFHNTGFQQNGYGIILKTDSEFPVRFWAIVYNLNIRFTYHCLLVRDH